MMGTGGVCWYLGADGVWIEPAVPDAEEGQSTGEAAAQLAGELGCVLVTDVPADVDPRAGERVDDACVGAVLDYMDGFPEELASQVTQFSAASEASVSCGLESGVTVLLGEPTDISSKASVVLKLCETYQDQITYINVRTPSSPTFRRVDSENVQSSPEE